MARGGFVGGVFGLVAASCSVETTDLDVQPLEAFPITVSPRVSAISEAGDTAVFTVALPSRPRGPIRIDVAIDHASEAQAVPASLTFMPNDWGPKTIQIVAVDDTVFDGDIPLSIRLDVSSPNPHYDGYELPALDVLSVDDDYVVTGYRARSLFPDAEANPIRLNNRSQVVADVAYPGDVLHAFLWDDGVVTDLGAPTRATDLNDAGVVVGFLGDDRFSFRYENGQVSPVPGKVLAINEQGDMVGDALYVAGQRTELAGGAPVSGLAMNALTHVTGLFPAPPFHERAFFWDGAFSDLGSFGGPRAAGLSINEHDQLVGFMWTPQIASHAIYWDGGAVIDLGTATGAPGAVAAAINNRGDIAGNDQDSAREPTTGWVGRAGEPLTTIDSLLVDGSCFFSMKVLDNNDRGEILARAVACNAGSPRAYLFEPIKGPR